jgi:hypothetical protein
MRRGRPPQRQRHRRRCWFTALFPLVLFHCRRIHAFGGLERHGLDQAEPVALVAVELAGDAGPAVAALDRGIAGLQQLVAGEGALVDLARHARGGRHHFDTVAEPLLDLLGIGQRVLAGTGPQLPPICGIAADFLLILERFGPFEF